jgi:D-alanine-D-alanine ligase
MIPNLEKGPHLKIQVLSGGISHERDISLKSGRRVADALAEAGATVVIREPDENLFENIEADAPDVIWPTLHGASGEDGALRDLLALSGVPFVGASADSARLAWDKSIAKILVARSGIQTPPSVTLPKETFRELNAEAVLKRISHSLSFPVVVKPARSGSAQGVTIVEDAKQLSRAMIDAYVYCDVAIIEAPNWPSRSLTRVQEPLPSRRLRLNRPLASSAMTSARLRARLTTTCLHA